MQVTEPKIEHRDAQPYAAVRAQVTMREMGTVLPPLIGEVFGFLQRQGVAPAGPPFFRYLVVDMERQLDMEVGWPVAHAVSGEGRISAGVLPAGRYAVAVHTGHPDKLVGATAALLAWGEENSIAWQMSDDGKTWDARLESYLTDPAEEPDMNKWRTELAFLVAGGTE
jgi:effector-binding domain-containing protein